MRTTWTFASRTESTGPRREARRGGCRTFCAGPGVAARCIAEPPTRSARLGCPRRLRRRGLPEAWQHASTPGVGNTEDIGWGQLSFNGHRERFVLLYATVVDRGLGWGACTAWRATTGSGKRPEQISAVNRDEAHRKGCKTMIILRQRRAEAVRCIQHIITYHVRVG